MISAFRSVPVILCLHCIQEINLECDQYLGCSQVFPPQISCDKILILKIISQIDLLFSGLLRKADAPCTPETVGQTLDDKRKLSHR